LTFVSSFNWLTIDFFHSPSAPNFAEAAFVLHDAMHMPEAYKTTQGGVVVPDWAMLFFARDFCDTPKDFMHSRLNDIGRNGGIEIIEV